MTPCSGSTPSASIQQFGFQFQAPINRRVERNQYRADQIQYQRARRAYMLLRDQIVQPIRLDMRELDAQPQAVRHRPRAGSLQLHVRPSRRRMPCYGLSEGGQCR